MKLQEVEKSLNEMFAHQPMQGSVRNIIFWYDEKGEFEEDVDNLELSNVQTIKVDNNSMFYTKYYIEKLDTESNLLVYSPETRPSNKENWLTDIIKYSRTFSTDKVSLHMLNFGMDLSLKHVMERYITFFNNNKRLQRFEKYSLVPFTEKNIDLGVLSAVCELPAPNLDNVVKLLLIENAHGEDGLYKNISKLANLDVLWDKISKTYGYVFEDRNIDKLSVMLLLTHLKQNINMSFSDEWEEYVSKNTNCYVFTDNFMKNVQDFENYNKLASLVAEKLDLKKVISKVEIDKIIDCDTFKEIDECIIDRIYENLTLDIEEYTKYNNFIQSRRGNRYYKEYENEYSLLLNACNILEFKKIIDTISASSANALLEKYVAEYYKIDLYYRHFILSYDRIENGEKYKKLYDKIENIYTNWYLNDLSVKFSELLGDEKLNLSITGKKQYRFYTDYIDKLVSRDERAIVIISDGLRYESATELVNILNSELSSKNELSYMTSCIPSNTKLGMAALLPHKKLEINKNGDVLVDGMSTQGVANRQKILESKNKESLAITYKEFTKLKLVKKIKDAIKGKKLIYIYHNTIDDIGDSAGTENEVFEATEKCFKELLSLVNTLFSAGAINIIITADHGYIYRRTPLLESDKTPKNPEDSIEIKRRYIVSSQCQDIQGTSNFPLSYIDKDLYDIWVCVPKGANCFKIQGAGTNYVHGGASLHEIVVPVISIKNSKNSKKPIGTEKTTLSYSGISKKITNTITYLTFFQNEKVDEKVLPLRVKVYFTDEEGNRISNENIIIADSESLNPDDRTYKEKFTLRNIKYDRSKDYYLFIEDDEGMVRKVYYKIPFKIDLMFGNVNF